MSKYLVIVLGAASLVEAKSLRDAKVSVQSMNPDVDLLVVSKKSGEVYALRVGGKFKQVQHSRKFSQRGVKEPACQVPTIQNVCADVIKRIELEQIVADGGNFISHKISEVLSTMDPQASAQKFVNENKCSVCAKGGLFVSYVGLYNHVTIGQMNNVGYVVTDSWPKPIIELFGRKLLDEIEVAFELELDFAWTTPEISMTRKTQLINRYEDIEDQNERLKKIMQDVIDGTF